MSGFLVFLCVCISNVNESKVHFSKKVPTLSPDFPLKAVMCGCGIERENDIFGSVASFDEGGNDAVSGDDEVSDIEEASGIDEISGTNEESGDGEVSA